MTVTGFYTKDGKVRPITGRVKEYSSLKRRRYPHTKERLDIIGCDPAKDSVKVKVDDNVVREFGLKRHPAPYAVVAEKPVPAPPPAEAEQKESESKGKTESPPLPPSPPPSPIRPTPEFYAKVDEMIKLEKQLEGARKNEKSIVFRQDCTDMDDDSYSFWTIDKRLPRDVFMALYKNGAVWKVEGDEEEYGHRRSYGWGYDKDKATEILKKSGYTVVDQNVVDRLSELKEQVSKMYSDYVKHANEQIRAYTKSEFFPMPKEKQREDGETYREMLPFPEGEELKDAQYPPNIYGGGWWYVIQPDAIWIIENNGGDGDAWDANNIRTGGAGAIGWKAPRTPELEGAVRTASTSLKDIIEERKKVSEKEQAP